MGKKKKRLAKSAHKIDFQSSKRSRSLLHGFLFRILLIGGVVVLAGYLMLSKAGPKGEDAFSFLAPLLLVTGYAIIAFGLSSGRK